MFVSPCVEKFNTVSNNHGRMHKCNFTIPNGKYPFSANLVQNIKIISLSWHVVPKLIWKCRIEWWYSLFPFLTGNTFLGQTWSEKSKLSVEAEIWYFEWFKYAECNGDMQDSPFWTNLFQKVKFVSLTWNFLPRLIQICKIQWWCSLFLF